MTTMFIDKLRIKELEETLANSTTVLAFVGAGDLAVEKLRAARFELVNRATSFDSKAFREQAQASFAGHVEALQAEVLTAPEQLKALPEKAQEWPAKAQSLFADVVSTAFSTYGGLAGRGQVVVTQVRGERAVADDIEPVSRPVKAAPKAAATKPAPKPAAKKTAKKAAKKSTTTPTAGTSDSAGTTS